ncbi:Uncharacterised protein [Mycobacteroides abscessus subsp. abscessus]|nr:Uncharacterised protein [Mycobacteroides abscessus subsp. abscessus]
MSVAAPTARVPSAGTVTARHWGTGRPFTVTRAGAPATQTKVSAVKCRVGPASVASNPGAPSGFPTARLPRRNERSSIGPDGGTPTCQYPVRPGQSCTVVSMPGAVTLTVLLLIGFPPPSGPGWDRSRYMGC